MSELITYEDKIRLKSQNVSDKYKVTAEDMNEIKRVVNNNAEEVDEINKPENWVSVGIEAPTDGRRVWFENGGKNLLNIKGIVKGRLDNGVIGYKSDVTSLILNDNSFSFTTNANYRGVTTDFIPIKNGNYVLISGQSDNSTISIGAVAFYDANFNWLSNKGTAPTSYGWKADNNVANAKYIRIYFYLPTSGTCTISNPMVEFGITASTYEPYIEKSINVDDESFISMSDLVSVGVNQPSDGKRVWFKKSKNLYVGYANMLTGFLPQSGAYPTTNSSFPNARYMLVKLNTGEKVTTSGITSNTNGRVRFIDTSTNQVVGSIDQGSSSYYATTASYGDGFKNGTITAKQDIILGFMLISENEYGLENFQIEMGSSATSYEPYNEGIYVDNEQWYSKPRILWSGKATSVSVNLTGYSLIEVIFCSNDNFYNSLKVPVSGSTFSRALALCNSSLSDPMESSGSLYLKYGKATLTQSGITIKSNVEVAITNTASQIRWQDATNTLLYITTIIGYK